MVFADLHMHTTASDGELTLEEVIATAKKKNISVIAITDHDTIHPDLHNVVINKNGVTVIRSIELRVKTDYGRIDLLGYGVTKTPELMEELHRLQENRKNRAQKIIDNVEEILNIELDISGSEGMGRPHIARAIAQHPDSNHTYDEAFEELIGDECEAYVPREITTFEKGVSLLSESCRLVGLAHPFRYDNPEDIFTLLDSVDAIEKNYPYEENMPLSQIDEVAETYNLSLTGGSDAHRDDLGKDGLSEQEFYYLRDDLLPEET